jgi:hypothetical protein
MNSGDQETLRELRTNSCRDEIAEHLSGVPNTALAYMKISCMVTMFPSMPVISATLTTLRVPSLMRLT